MSLAGALAAPRVSTSRGLFGARLQTLALLILAVLVLHLGLVAWLNQHLPAMHAATSPRIERIELAFVHDLLPAEPVALLIPAPVAPPAQKLRPVAAEPAASAASAPQADIPAPVVVAQSPPLAAAPGPDSAVLAEPPAEPLLEPQPTLQPIPQLNPPAPPPPTAQTASDPLPALPTEVNPTGLPADTAAPTLALPSPGATRFEWPLSTRLSYHLVGNYRGPVEGHARVEWLRLGLRYQVHLDVNIASVVTRRLSSEGTLGEDGLKPQRYEEVTKVLLSTPRQRSVQFQGDRVILANGRNERALPQVQDTASQFVQLAWMFATRSQRLQVGERIEVPLALPGRMDRWQYVVHAEEDLELPTGVLRAFHMKPERAQAPAGELVIETWFAPSLQYLPVRILIRQDAETFVELQLSRLPQQVAPVDALPR